MGLLEARLFASLRSQNPESRIQESSVFAKASSDESADKGTGSRKPEESWAEAEEAVAAASEADEAVEPVPLSTISNGETEKESLPPLDELVQRIPPDVRAALDDLFRAKFIGVKNVSKTILKKG